jgi:Tfx family DNA-binding protein
MAKINCGLLTKQQIEVLTRRHKGATLGSIAARLHTTRQNVSQIEKRARRNVSLARRTLHAYDRSVNLGIITIPAGTRKVDIPSIVLTEGDRRNVHIRANFITLFDDIDSRVPDCISSTRVIAPIEIIILPEGRVTIYKKNEERGGLEPKNIKSC